MAAATSGVRSTGRTTSRKRAAMMRDMSRMSETSWACSIALRSIVSSPRGDGLGVELARAQQVDPAHDRR